MLSKITVKNIKMGKLGENKGPLDTENRKGENEKNIFQRVKESKAISKLTIGKQPYFSVVHNPSTCFHLVSERKK